MLDFEIIRGILIPFAGTTLGAACVFFMKKEMHMGVQRALTGFAAGVMVAASVWSLLIPALDQSAHMGKWGFIPAAVGFLLGMGFLLLLDELVPHLHMNSEEAEGPSGGHPPQYPGRDGRGRGLCRLDSGKHGYFRHGRAGACSRYRHPEFPGGSHHLHAA